MKVFLLILLLMPLHIAQADSEVSPKFNMCFSKWFMTNALPNSDNYYVLKCTDSDLNFPVRYEESETNEIAKKLADKGYTVTFSNHERSRQESLALRGFIAHKNLPADYDPQRIHLVKSSLDNRTDSEKIWQGIFNVENVEKHPAHYFTYRIKKDDEVAMNCHVSVHEERFSTIKSFLEEFNMEKLTGSVDWNDSEVYAVYNSTPRRWRPYWLNKNLALLQTCEAKLN